MVAVPAEGLPEEAIQVVVARGTPCTDSSGSKDPSPARALRVYSLTYILIVENMKRAEKYKEVGKQLLMVHYPGAINSETDHIVSGPLLYIVEVKLYFLTLCSACFPGW